MKDLNRKENRIITDGKTTLLFFKDKGGRVFKEIYKSEKNTILYTWLGKRVQKSVTKFIKNLF